jgi:polar amino acid transport system substrate-binding protein
MTASAKVELKKFALIIILNLITLSSASIAYSRDLLADARAGEPFRIGFANEHPWAFPDENGNAAGLMNVIAINVLKEMGITNIQPVVVEWNGLIPGLQANRYDMITGGMYVMKSRCENVSFASPVIKIGDVFAVVKGNPKKIATFDDVKSSGAILVTTAGNNTVEVAKGVGIANENIMQVPGLTEIMAAVVSGRADVASSNYFSMKTIVDNSKGKLELTDLNKMPEWTLNWSAMAFRQKDKSFIEEYNKAQLDYIGSEAMLSSVAKYGYTKGLLPGDTEIDWICANR